MMVLRTSAWQATAATRSTTTMGMARSPTSRPALEFPPADGARSQGHVMGTIEHTSPDMKYLELPLLLKNESGHFVRVLAGDVFQKEWAGRGAAFGDIDTMVISTSRLATWV